MNLTIHKTNGDHIYISDVSSVFKDKDNNVCIVQNNIIVLEIPEDTIRHIVLTDFYPPITPENEVEKILLKM